MKIKSSVTKIITVPSALIILVAESIRFTQVNNKDLPNNSPFSIVTFALTFQRKAILTVGQIVHPQKTTDVPKSGI